MYHIKVAQFYQRGGDGKGNIFLSSPKRIPLGLMNQHFTPKILCII